MYRNERNRPCSFVLSVALSLRNSFLSLDCQ